MRSIVPEHVGECKPVWLNINAVDNRIDGGITGFFRLIKNFWIFRFKYGPKFHGIIKNGVVESTEEGGE